MLPRGGTRRRVQGKGVRGRAGALAPLHAPRQSLEDARRSRVGAPGSARACVDVVDVHACRRRAEARGSRASAGGRDWRATGGALALFPRLLASVRALVFYTSSRAATASAADEARSPPAGGGDILGVAGHRIDAGGSALRPPPAAGAGRAASRRARARARVPAGVRGVRGRAWRRGAVVADRRGAARRCPGSGAASSASSASSGADSGRPLRVLRPSRALWLRLRARALSGWGDALSSPAAPSFAVVAGPARSPQSAVTASRAATTPSAGPSAGASLDRPAEREALLLRLRERSAMLAPARVAEILAKRN